MLLVITKTDDPVPLNSCKRSREVVSTARKLLSSTDTKVGPKLVETPPHKMPKVSPIQGSRRPSSEAPIRPLTAAHSTTIFPLPSLGNMTKEQRIVITRLNAILTQQGRPIDPLSQPNTSPARLGLGVEFYTQKLFILSTANDFDLFKMTDNYEEYRTDTFLKMSLAFHLTYDPQCSKFIFTASEMRRYVYGWLIEVGASSKALGLKQGSGKVVKKLVTDANEAASKGMKWDDKSLSMTAHVLSAKSREVAKKLNEDLKMFQTTYTDHMVDKLMQDDLLSREATSDAFMALANQSIEGLTDGTDDDSIFNLVHKVLNADNVSEPTVDASDSQDSPLSSVTEQTSVSNDGMMLPVKHGEPTNGGAIKDVSRSDYITVDQFSDLFTAKDPHFKESIEADYIV
ncbi:CYFA0S02e05479g1_1 [Cyberlindnera fabianii]|uniref:CYFA0S02e05479g1_1 n=2 Tax=Cyberlindnera fabianii TaxID=36022 RepID=A0A061AMI3_CYBFA|nr:CYFA0S02e05479g1_1 [Cyberlindnera fabianii]